MAEARQARRLTVGLAAAGLALIWIAPAAAESPRGPAPAPSPKPPAPASPANRLERLAAEAAESLARYRATLEPVLAIQERELARQAELMQLRLDLHERGALSERDVEDGRRALAAARKDVEDTRQAMLEADRMLAEAWMAEALARLRPLERGGYEETPGLIRYDGPAGWSLAEGAPRLERFFLARFGRPLPISAFGQTALHDRMGFDHRNALDVALHPDSPEGRALMEYLRQAGTPFIAARGRLPGSASGAHIHVGQPSPRLIGRR
jgi:hypothetical protein